jgi:RsiW-degrading membrane proteinase PrsW (M82 family)
MNPGMDQKEWHYLIGMEVRGPVSLNEISTLLEAGTIAPDVMIASRESPRLRPAAEVLQEARAGSAAAPPPLPPAAPAQRNLLDRIGETLSSVAGTEKLEGFSLHEMFSETFTRRSSAEMENYFIVGTDRTTPKITEVQTGWPKPWLFMRFLLFFFVLYAGFVTAYQYFHNENLVPGLMILGASAMPLATLILFFELNTPRNVSIYRLAILVGLGGLTSLAVSLIGYDIGHLSWLGASSAGIIEELAKLIALVLIVRGARYKYILNGMLFGAAIGAGFACFETAGYAYRTALAYRSSPYGPQAILSIIWQRGMLAPFMHVAWTAMVGAALWRVKGANRLSIHDFLNPRFYRVLLFAMVLHMLWNFHRLDLQFYLKEIVLGAAAWFVIWGLVQQGLRQVRDEQRLFLTAEQPPAPIQPS